MAFWNKVSGELVDIIEYVASDPDVLVYRFPRYQNQIKFGARLIVREGQGAIFVNEGKLADVFAPGTYTLETQNLPLLSTLAGWKYGFNSPFRAEVYFYTTRTILDQQWGTQQPITMDLPKYGLGEIRGYGQVSYKISDPSVFFRQIVGVNGFVTGTELRDYLRGLIVAQFSEALTRSHPTVEELVSGLSVLDDTLQTSINAKIAPLGFQLTQFVIENLSLPPQLKDQVFEYSRLNNIDLGKLTQLKTAEAIPGMVAGSGAGGIAGMGVQMGVGLAAAQGVMRALQGLGIDPKNGMNVVTQSPFAGMAGSAPMSPPPLPTAVNFHVAIHGQVQGPMDIPAVQALAQAGTVTAATLVWRPGMQSWSPLSNVPELSQLIQAEEPPPLPKGNS